MNSYQALGDEELMKELREMAISPELEQEINRVNRRARRQTWLRAIVGITFWGTVSIVSGFTYYGLIQLGRLVLRALGANL